MNEHILIIILQYLVAACGGFSCVCVAMGWLIKIIKGIKKPADDVNNKLQRDYDRINELDQNMKRINDILAYLKEGFDVQLENDKVILEHMRTNNSTGEIEKREKAIYDFLKGHQSA